MVPLRRQEWPQEVGSCQKVRAMWEKHTPQAECRLSRRVKATLKYEVVSFSGLGNFIG